MMSVLGFIFAAFVGVTADVPTSLYYPQQAAVRRSPVNDHQTTGSCRAWPLWDAYLKRFVQQSGRVLDVQSEKITTTSEAQAYTLFFALVANDRKLFEKIFHWIENNLAAGDLTVRLPSWHWGKRNDEEWGPLDTNSASDADMWLAYTLMQAGKLWQMPRYHAMGKIVLDHIKEQSLVDLPGFGTIVLPGPRGFVLNNGTWRLNPSYLPLQLVRAFAAADPAGPWEGMAERTIKLLQAASPLGLVPDWVLYETERGWIPDTVTGPVGSYDAIRVYLWTGMLDSSDPSKGILMRTLHAMHKHLAEYSVAPPQKVNTQTGKREGKGPAGFSAALLPYLISLDDRVLVAQQRQRLVRSSKSGLIGDDPRYYDQVLTLFGQGWTDQRFRFDLQGQLLPDWKLHCSITKRHATIVLHPALQTSVTRRQTTRHVDSQYVKPDTPI